MAIPLGPCVPSADEAAGSAGWAAFKNPVLLMSEGVSVERRHLRRRFGAEVILLPDGGTYQAGIDRAREMAARDCSSLLGCRRMIVTVAGDKLRDNGLQRCG